LRKKKKQEILNAKRFKLIAQAKQHSKNLIDEDDFNQTLQKIAPRTSEGLTVPEYF
jgi:hypothetical protein